MDLIPGSFLPADLKPQFGRYSMKRTRISIVLAISLLLIGSGLTYSQTEPGPAKLPRDMVTNVSYDATIDAGQVYKFKIPLQQGGTFVKIRFVPSKEKPMKNPTLTVTRASDLDAALSRSARQQETALKAAPLSLIVTVAGRQLSPLPAFSGGTAFTVQIDRSLSTSGAGEGAMKNLTSAPLTGKVLVSSIKLDGLQTFKANRDRDQINSALNRMKNPDLFWSIYHTMQRHAANYPGGQSDYEKQYSARLHGMQ
ncbi:MAG: hypothetical protein NT022_11055, partial [Deltaproteobacteria bacterium]|nr:hypothetical protein [Deltaproteobacteria bacterium]